MLLDFLKSPTLDYALYRLKYRFGRYLPLTAPVDISLELSSKCNMACAYCYHADPHNLPFTRGIMPWETIETILDQGAALKVPSVKFNWKGESTMSPHFYKATHRARTLNHATGGVCYIDRLTNSNFKFPTDREDIFKGLCYQTKVKVSLDSFRKDVFETQRALGDHELTIENIDKFYNHPLRKNTELVIQAVRTQLNYNEDIEHEVKCRWPEATISVRDMVAGRVDKDTDHLEAKQRDLSARQSCLQAHVRIIFSWDGRAFPCCPDIGEQLCLGDIKTDTLRDIFRGPRAVALRHSLLDKTAFEKNPCLNCSSHESYNGYKPNWSS